jgi:RimJ/RimL family protein N-acetyltransferase
MSYELEGSSMDVRVLVAGDAARFQSVRLAGLAECPTAFSSSYEEEYDRPLARVAERLVPTADSRVLGAFAGDALVGVTGLRRESARKLAHKAFIWGVYVVPAARKRGVAHLLLQEALAYAASMKGLRQVNLGVNSANPAAIALYTSAGFEKYGVEKGFMMVDGVLCDEILMARVIEPDASNRT